MLSMEIFIPFKRDDMNDIYILLPYPTSVSPPNWVNLIFSHCSFEVEVTAIKRYSLQPPIGSQNSRLSGTLTITYGFSDTIYCSRNRDWFTYSVREKIRFPYSSEEKPWMNAGTRTCAMSVCNSNRWI